MLKMVYSSDKAFSIGVPLRAILLLAMSAEAALVVFAVAFLTLWASSRMTVRKACPS